jgi:hypothetical protein
MICSNLVIERIDVWDSIIDSVVQAEAPLVARDEIETVKILLGKDSLDVIPCRINATFYYEVGVFIQTAASLLNC